MINNIELNHFSLDEFDSPDQIGSGKKMNKEFLLMLDEARSIASIPFKINSGYRSKEHNKSVGGVSGSSHRVGFAADIHCNESRNRFIMVNALIQVGFNRIGIGNTFIHVDNDPNKSPEVIWLY